jgi:hypothetical protein
VADEAVLNKVLSKIQNKSHLKDPGSAEWLTQSKSCVKNRSEKYKILCGTVKNLYLGSTV